MFRAGTRGISGGWTESRGVSRVFGRVSGGQTGFSGRVAGVFGRRRAGVSGRVAGSFGRRRGSVSGRVAESQLSGPMPAIVRTRPRRDAHHDLNALVARMSAVLLNVPKRLGDVGDIFQLRGVLVEDMVVAGSVGVVETVSLSGDNALENARPAELVKRVVDSGKRHLDAFLAGAAVDVLGGVVAVDNARRAVRKQPHKNTDPASGRTDAVLLEQGVEFGNVGIGGRRRV